MMSTVLETCKGIR